MSSMPREALKTSASKPGVMRGPELDAQRLGARDHFLRVGKVGRGVLVHDLGCRVAQHAFCADVENLDDALRVGGDTREVGAVEYGVLQGPGLEQGFLAPDLGALRPHGLGIENVGIATIS